VREAQLKDRIKANKVRMLAAIVLLALSRTACFAGDLPQRFLGFWLLEDTLQPGHVEKCSQKDWRVNDRVAFVDRKGIQPIEGACRITSVKELPLPNPRFPQITSPVIVGMMCAVEGDVPESPVEAVWSIHSIAGKTLMIHVNVHDPTKIDLYQKCF
jgi:hypothetical protein